MATPDYKKHLAKDARLKKIIERYEILPLPKGKDIHLELCSSIISQQLNTNVAAVIYARFLNLFSKKHPQCEDILAIPHEKLKAIGLSESKTNYVRNVCSFFIEQKVTDKSLHKMEDEELIEFLSQIKGVGRWTAEMILIFTLGRENVFAVDDLGIQMGMAGIYGWDSTDKKELKRKMIQKAAGWNPYRTYGCRYVWAWRNDQLGKR